MAEFAEASLTTFLAANLNTEVAAVATSYADAVPSPAIVQFYSGARAEIPEFPACLVWHHDDVSTLEPGEFGNTYAVYRHDLFIEVAVTSDLQQTVERMTMRYGEAVVGLIYKNQTIGNPVSTSNSRIISVTPRHMFRSKVQDHELSTLLQSAAWHVEVRTEELWP